MPIELDGAGAVRIRSAVLFDAEGAELGEGPQQLLPLNGGRVDRASGQQAGERVRDLLREERLVRRVAEPRRRQVLERNVVDVAEHRETASARAGVDSREHP